MKILFALVLLVGIVLLSAKVFPTDAHAAFEIRGPERDPLELGHKELTIPGEKDITESKATLHPEYDPAPREFMNDFSILIDKFNNHIHSDVLKLIANFVLGLVQFV
jgi:hypothetical protein